MKDKIIAAIEARVAGLKNLAQAIFSYEETAFREVRSSKALADYLKGVGFGVE